MDSPLIHQWLRHATWVFRNKVDLERDLCPIALNCLAGDAFILGGPVPHSGACTCLPALLKTTFFVLDCMHAGLLHKHNTATCSMCTSASSPLYSHLCISNCSPCTTHHALTRSYVLQVRKQRDLGSRCFVQLVGKCRTTRVGRPTSGHWPTWAGQPNFSNWLLPTLPTFQAGTCTIWSTILKSMHTQYTYNYFHCA
jgi:hypothetical protein